MNFLVDAQLLFVRWREEHGEVIEEATRCIKSEDRRQRQMLANLSGRGQHKQHEDNCRA
jgi:hypothetical protein